MIEGDLRASADPSLARKHPELTAWSDRLEQRESFLATVLVSQNIAEVVMQASILNPACPAAARVAG